MRQTIALSPPTVVALAGESLQVVASPCWEMALPDVISASLSWDACTSIPVGCVSAFTRFFLAQHRPSPCPQGVDFPTNTRERDFATEVFFGTAVIP